jgi:hypothetical protein
VRFNLSTTREESIRDWKDPVTLSINESELSMGMVKKLPHNTLCGVRELLIMRSRSVEIKNNRVW